MFAGNSGKESGALGAWPQQQAPILRKWFTFLLLNFILKNFGYFVFNMPKKVHASSRS
jgi:hypothetical protein